MTAVKKVFTGNNPITYQCFVAVAGGQLVVPGTAGNAGLIGPAGAGAVNCLGVATTDGLPVGTANTSTDPSGFPIIATDQADENVAVDPHGVYRLACTGTIALGDPIKCGTAGSVVKFVDGTDNPGLKIGRCVDPAGGVNTGTALCLVNIA